MTPEALVSASVRVLVTGAAGFIGSTLVDRLLSEGHRVAAVDDLSGGLLTNLADARAAGVSFTRYDITGADLGALVADEAPEVICHLAAQVSVRVSVAEPLRDVQANVVGTVNVLEAARRAGTRKVVFTSSGGSIYGTPATLPVDEQARVDPHSPYAAAKVAGELYCGSYRALHGLQSTSLALGNVYGPRQDPHGEAGVVAIFSRAMLEARPTQVYGDGGQTRDYVYVHDVVDAFVKALSAGNGHRFNIGTGIATSDLALHSLVAAAVGRPDSPGFAPARLGDLRAIALDCRAAGAGLGWGPATPLATGIAQTVEWFRTHPD